MRGTCNASEGYIYKKCGLIMRKKFLLSIFLRAVNRLAGIGGGVSTQWGTLTICAPISVKEAYVFTFYIIPRYSYETRRWYLSLRKIKTCTCCIVNTRAVDALATCVARASTTIVLTYFAWNIFVSAQEEQSHITY